jgi:hypothetical protein
MASKSDNLSFVGLKKPISEKGTTSTKTVTRIQTGTHSSQEKYSNIYLTFVDFKIASRNKSNVTVRLKISKESGKRDDYKIILNSKQTNLSFDSKSNNGGGGNQFEGWKFWLHENDNSISILSKKLPENELAGLRAICGTLQDKGFQETLLGKSIKDAYDPQIGFHHHHYLT